MNEVTKHFFTFCCILILAVSLAACGGGSGSTATPTTTVSGVVMAGPAGNSSVTVKTAGGATVAGPVLTLADGSYTVAIPNAALGSDLIIEALGGTFQDEATAAGGVTLGSLSAHVPAGTLNSGSVVTLDPASTIIREMVKGGKARAAALSTFNTAFGFVPNNSIKPVFAGLSSAATTAQRLAGLQAAAFSQLTKDLGIPADKQHELLLALAEDLSDDVLDGVKTGGTLVTTASATAIPADINNRFVNALISFQMNSSLNKSKLTPDMIGTPLFVKKGLTTNYIVEYLPGSTAAATGKTSFRIKLSDRSGNPVSGKAVTIRPYMYMATKSHTTPIEAVVDNNDGTYACTAYYVMSSMMNGVSMGVWELKVTIDGTESVKFFPTVAMPPMGVTTLAKLTGVNDAIMGMAGLEKRTWFLFNDGLVAGLAGTYTFNLFLATKEMVNAQLTFPAVKSGDTLLDQAAAPWLVNSVTLEVSTDKSTWLAATDAGNSGHWTVSELSGLTAGVSGSLYVRLTVNGELKTTDGLALAADGKNGYQTFTIIPL